MQINSHLKEVLNFNDQKKTNEIVLKSQLVTKNKKRKFSFLNLF